MKPDADLNYDCVVDELDLKIIGDNWLISTYDVTPTAPGTPGPIGHYKFENNYDDSSGYANTGDPCGDPTFVAGTVGSWAIALDGDDYVRMDGVADDVTDNDITLSGWVKTTQSVGPTGWWFSCNTGTGGNVVLFGIANGLAAVYDGAQSAYECYSTTNVSDGEWHLLTYTRSGPTGYLHVDGVIEDTHTANYNFSPNDRWSIGQEWDTNTASNFFIGAVDDARVYDRALSPDEVAGLAGIGAFTQPIEVFLSPQDPAINAYVDNIIDLKDYAELANAWLEEKLWPPE